MMPTQFLRRTLPFFLIAFMAACDNGVGQRPIVNEGATDGAEVTVRVERSASVSAGGSHTCWVRATGTVACWGDNAEGQATPPAGLFASVSAGGLHTCGVRDSGVVACWGDNAEGQSTPPGGLFASVSAGDFHTCGMRESGDVACWGLDDDGQSTSPGGLFVSVSAGGLHTCGLRESGVVACWGDNAEGQSAPPGGLFASVSAGDFHTCGVRESGDVACWGLDDEGQSTPPGGLFASVSAGGLHTCGVRDSGAVACWGSDGAGQSAPPAGSFASVSAGGLHTCGVRDAGAVACWPQPADDQFCQFMPAAETRGPVPGLIVAADVLLPEGHQPDYGVHVRFNGSVGAAADFDTLRAAYSDAAVLDCRGKAVLSPGFVNAHEHPAYSYAFPDPNLNPGYIHRDEWRLGINGKVQLPPPPPYWFEPDDTKRAAILMAMELRHLLGGATTIAGSGGVPGVIRNINRHRRDGDLALYDAEAELSTFPFSFQVVEDLRDECAGGPAYRFPVPDSGDLAFMAYVPHVGEGRLTSCAARAEVARYLQRVQRRDRRYALVHGVAADRQDYAVMQEFDVTLVWSPRSNLALYGETVDLAGVLESGVRVALSTDWSPSGSFNMREEVKCAQRVAQDASVALSHEELWRMSTGNGAYALGLEDLIGAIVPGSWADLILVKFTGGNPYDAVLTATDEDVLATWIDGRTVLLAGALNEALGVQDCVTLDDVAPKVCGVLDAFDLSPERFGRHTEDVVPVNDVSRQAPCGDDS